MSQEVETSYDRFLADLDRKLVKIDVELAMKLMYLERKFPEVEPNVELSIKLKSGADAKEKAYAINKKFGWRTASRGNHVTVAGRANLEDLIRLSSSSYVEEVSGTANPASY